MKCGNLPSHHVIFASLEELRGKMERNSAAGTSLCDPLFAAASMGSGRWHTGSGWHLCPQHSRTGASALSMKSTFGPMARSPAMAVRVPTRGGLVSSAFSVQQAVRACRAQSPEGAPLPVSWQLGERYGGRSLTWRKNAPPECGVKSFQRKASQDEHRRDQLALWLLFLSPTKTSVQI